ncbi:MAG: hypothetical protein IJT95_06255 [Abditibacteriota bacterium]|nr:hypothetical protein [Abditibacteriota bacterium]
MTTQDTAYLVVRKLYFDTLLGEKYKDKPLVIRYTHRIDYLTGGMSAYINAPLPVNASLVNGTIIRLEYGDGTVEHWKFAPDIIDIAQNYYMFGQQDDLSRNLLWWNQKGKGSIYMTSILWKKGHEILRTRHDQYKAWNYSDSEKEPVYK